MKSPTVEYFSGMPFNFQKPKSREETEIFAKHVLRLLDYCLRAL